MTTDVETLKVPLSQPWITENDIAAVVEVLRTPCLSMGLRVRALEQAMPEYAGTATAVACSSGTAGLHLCLAAAGIGPRDEGSTSPFSFVASANCALYQGATPVLADIDPLTLTIDPNQVEARITERTRALVSVDVFGQPPAVEELRAIARRDGWSGLRRREFQRGQSVCRCTWSSYTENGLATERGLPGNGGCGRDEIGTAVLRGMKKGQLKQVWKHLAASLQEERSWRRH